MKLIVGLGNPGPQYQKTRHNVGFMVIDEMAKKLGVTLNEKKFNGVYYKEKDFIIAKPMTYMNKSGDFVKAIVDFYKIAEDDIIIVLDDMDLPFGKVSIKQKGSSGGHNGMKSIIECMGTQEIKRLKIGIGRGENVVSFVLGKFSYNDWQVIEKLIPLYAEVLISFIYNDIRFVMNKYTGKLNG